MTSLDLFSVNKSGPGPGRAAVKVDRTTVATGTATAAAEIATLRQKLAAAAARIQEEKGKPNTTQAYKDNALKPFTDKIKSVPTLDGAWLHFCAT